MLRNEHGVHDVLLPTKGEVNNEEKTAHRDIESKSEKEKESERVPASRACSAVGYGRSEGRRALKVTQKKPEINGTFLDLVHKIMKESGMGPLG